MKKNSKTRIKSLLFIAVRIFSWVLACIVIYWLILKVTNHSPTLPEINFYIIMTSLGLLVPTLLAIFLWMFKINSKLSRIDERTKNTNRVLFALADDFKKHIKEHKQ